MPISRRSALKKLGALTGTVIIPDILNSLTSTSKGKSRINQSVCKWPYDDIPLDEFCASVKKIGIKSVELVGPEGWPTLKKHGLDCAMPWGAELGLEKGFNDPALHDKLIDNYSKVIPQVAEAGFDRLICFSGNRNGMDDETGLNNCVKGLKKLMPLAEKHGVTLCMELLNSKIDHPDYMCDHTPWGVELCKRIGSDRFKLLYDIYHMQIMEGDIIRTIRDNISYIDHFHTGGVPGRHEIDDSQELNYPAIMRAIADTGYEGYVGQEFIPSVDDKIGSLQKAYQICDI